MSLSNGWLIVNQNTYRCLIVPTAEYIHSTVAEFAVQAMGEGFPVIFINKLPQGVSDGMISGKTLPENLRFCPVTTLAELPDLLDKFGIRDIVLDRPFPFLRYLHYRTGSDTFMFFNESLSDRVDTWIYLPVAGPAAFYDGEENKLYHALIRPEGKGSKVRVVLEPYESCVLVFGQEIPSDLPVRKPLYAQAHAGNQRWQISLATARNIPTLKIAGKQPFCTISASSGQTSREPFAMKPPLKCRPKPGKSTCCFWKRPMKPSRFGLMIPTQVSGFARPTGSPSANFSSPVATHCGSR